MTLLRRALALAGIAATAATGFVALPGGTHAASAYTADDVWSVTINGKYTKVVDDDSTIFGSSFSYGPTSSFTKTYYVSRSAPDLYSDPVWSACAGGEVHGETRTYAKLYEDRFVGVAVDLFLHEGDSCISSDIDGLRSYGMMSLFDGLPETHTIKVTNTSEGGLDSATLTFTAVAHRV
jgi:hypothetical protein